jgi:hypothetical protein
MDKTLTRIIRILLDEIEKQQDQAERLAELQAWKEQVEAAWPAIVEDE